MKKLLMIAIITLLLSGCSINSAGENKLTNDDLFAKKKGCSELQTEIETRIKKDWNDETRIAWLNKIFYSPKQNSCMYTMKISTNTNHVVREIHYLFDAFTNEKIESEVGCLSENDCGKSLMQASVDFGNTVAKYE